MMKARTLATIGVVVSIAVGAATLSQFDIIPWASKTALAKNLKDDATFRLSIHTDRRNQLFEKRDSYIDKRKPIPSWLRSSISRVCVKIIKEKGHLKLPNRCED